MNSTQEALQGIVNYEQISAMPILEVPSIKKEEIPNYIFCTHYAKAQERIDRTMERYNRKVDDLKAKLQQLESDIQYLEKEQSHWSGRANVYVDRTNSQDVERQNNAANQANHFLAKLSATRDKYNDTVEVHNEALQEAEEKLQELRDEALNVIDEDIVSVLDKCIKIAGKLLGSQNSEDQTTALEVSFIEMKVHHFFEDFIEENTARKDAKDRISEVNQHFSELCENNDVRNHLADLFRKNIYLMDNNDDKYGQISNAIEAIDKSQMEEGVQNFDTLFNEEFDTNFVYENIIDPSELEDVITRINERINSINENITKVNDAGESTKELAGKSVETNENINAILASMKVELENLGPDFVPSESFTIEMLDESVIDDYYAKELRSKVSGFREFLANEIDEEKLDTFLAPDADKYSIQKSENAINEANLLRLQDQRNRIAEHNEKMNGLIDTLGNEIKKVEGIPQEKSDVLKSEYTLKSILCSIPFVGIVFSFLLLKRINIFESSFRSTNQIYKELGKTLQAKNKTMIIVTLVVGLVLSIGCAVLLYAVDNKLSATLRLSLPGALLLVYLVTTGLLFTIGKKLDSYLGEESPVQENTDKE
jgi:prefoldin subunit 5